MASGRDMGGTGRNRESQRAADRAAADRNAGGTGSANDGRILSGSRLSDAFEAAADKNRIARATGGQPNVPGSGLGMPPGGTATSATYEPGSVPNVPDASPGQIIGTLGKLMPGGMLNDVPEAVDNMQNGYGMDRPYKGGVIGEAVDSALGTTPGQQEGYQRDRGRGASSFAPNDARGMDSGLPQDSRAIAGESYGAGTQALTGDSTDEQTGAGTDALYSDVTLQDRRKPRPVLGAGTQMVLG